MCLLNYGLISKWDTLSYFAQEDGVWLEEVRMPRSQSGFTLTELIVIIVVIGILAGVAITRYRDLTRNVTDGTAKAVLGALRGQNALMFCQRVVRGTTATYTMRDIANNMGGLKGFSWTAAATRFTMTVARNTYTFTLTPTPRAPTTLGSITAGSGTFSRW
jgi:prepilin-type N-terminal cleavage/methylation domain-containing protein